MTDDKPMSAEKRTQRAIRFWRETCCIEEIPSVDVLEGYVDAALRDHAAEAVEAEREACARLVEKGKSLLLEDKAVNDHCYALATAIRNKSKWTDRARTEGDS